MNGMKPVNDKSDEPKVTIVTPSYNQGQFIEETIRSVLAQTYPHVEYIVVDGNSTDDTHRVLKKHSARIDRLIIEPDEGQADAINKGFGLATGQLVGWLNSDDVLMPQAVEAAVACFRQHPGGTIFYGDAEVIDERGNHLYSLKPYNHLTFKQLINGRGWVVQPGSFYATNLVRQVGGVRPEFYILMDRDLWSRLLSVGDGWHVGTQVARFRRHDQAKSSEPPFRYLEETLRLNEDFRPSLFSWRSLQIIRLRLRCLVAQVQQRTGKT
jgi:glycosyltransferase involved in cell wall biosynthesis